MPVKYYDYTGGKLKSVVDTGKYIFLSLKEREAPLIFRDE